MHKYIFLLSLITITSLHSMNNHPKYQYIPLTAQSRISKDSTLSPNANIKEKKCPYCKKNKKQIKAEDNFKKCLKENIMYAGLLNSVEVPILCKEQARECILESGRARVADILADFKAAKDYL